MFSLTASANLFALHFKGIHCRGIRDNTVPRERRTGISSIEFARFFLKMEEIFSLKVMKKVANANIEVLSGILTKE